MRRRAGKSREHCASQLRTCYQERRSGWTRDDTIQTSCVLCGVPGSKLRQSGIRSAKCDGARPDPILPLSLSDKKSVGEFSHIRGASPWPLIIAHHIGGASCYDRVIRPPASPHLPSGWSGILNHPHLQVFGHALASDVRVEPSHDNYLPT